MYGKAFGRAAGALQQQRRRMPGVGPGQVPCAATRWAQMGVHQGPGGIQAQRSAGVLYRRHGRSRAAIGVVKVRLAKHAADLSHDRGRLHVVAGDVPDR